MKKLLLVGGGGHCRSIVNSLKKVNEYDEIGIVDKDSNIKIGDISVVGSDDDLFELHKAGYTHAFVSVGSVGDAKKRIEIFKTISSIGFEIPNIIDRDSIVGDITIGIGNFIGQGVNINTGVSIGDNCIINTGAIIDHDSVIESHSHLATGVVLSGGVLIGSGVHIGTNATIIQNIKIGENTIIGAGSVVVKNVGENKKAYGNPCKESV